jgi:protocatechuate 3,4-dioxygenase beta subunit
MKGRWGWWAVAGWLLLALQTMVHAQVMPPRDRSAAPAEKGTGMIRGFVVDAQTGEPLPRAFVSLTTMGGGRQPTTIQTDAEGGFEFRDLPPGRYLLSANRAPYLWTRYGQRGPDTSGTPIDVADDQAVDKIRIALSPGGVISGRVYDEFGLPAVGVRIQPLQYRYNNGRRQLMQASTSGFMSTTDDLGAFRIWGLTPGEYYVSAAPQPMFVNPGLTADQTGPITTYFPGTADSAAAQRVTVGAGKEASGVHIVLVSGRLAKLRGRAVTATGEPFAGATIQVTRQEANGTNTFSGGTVRPDGTFEIGGIAAGQYLLKVRHESFRDDASVETARASVTVTGEDVDNLFLSGGFGATLRGRIVTDEGGMPPMKPSQVMLRVEPAPEDRGTWVRPPPVNDDYSFELKGLFGRGRIDSNLVFQAGDMPGAPISGWALKAVYARGEDITGRYIDFDLGSTIDNVEVMFSRRWAEVHGTVIDERGQPVADASFVIFSADESRWTQDYRNVRPLRTDPNGTLRATGLRQGDYLLAFTGPIEPDQWSDPEYLRSLVERATRVSMLDGEKKTVSLRISTSP